MGGIATTSINQIIFILWRALLLPRTDALLDFWNNLFIRFHKSNIKEIAFGIVNIDISGESDNFSKAESTDELFILLSGPLINLVLSLVLKLIYFNGGCYIINLISYQNLFLGIVNLLPISSLDGGRILYILLSKKLDFILAERILNIISLLFLIPLCILGFLLLIKSKYNFSLLILGCYLLSYVLFRSDNL